jgi:hypothetical protein
VPIPTGLSIRPLTWLEYLKLYIVTNPRIDLKLWCGVMGKTLRRISDGMRAASDRIEPRAHRGQNEIKRAIRRRA